VERQVRRAQRGQTRRHTVTARRRWFDLRCRRSRQWETRKTRSSLYCQQTRKTKRPPRREAWTHLQYCQSRQLLLSRHRCPWYQNQNHGQPWTTTRQPCRCRQNPRSLCCPRSRRCLQRCTGPRHTLRTPCLRRLRRGAKVWAARLDQRRRPTRHPVLGGEWVSL